MEGNLIFTACLALQFFTPAVAPMVVEGNLIFTERGGLGNAVGTATVHTTRYMRAR